ncbi:MAG: PEP-CTERM sorting domain-containing protein [Roseiarcus sp.]
MTFDNTTLWSLGMTPGVYTWTWGAALSGEGDSFTLDVVAVPESSTWAMMLLGFGGLGFAGYNASRKCARVALRLL